MKHVRKLCLFVFIVVGLCLAGPLSFGQDILDGKAIQSRISNTFESMLNEVDKDDGGGVINSTFKNPSSDDVTRIREILVRTVNHVDQFMVDKSFPSVTNNSRTEAELNRIFQQILRSTIFSVDSKQIRPDLLVRSSQNKDVAEYIALRFTHEVKVAKEIESINPNQKEKETILSQVETLKNRVIEVVQKQFPDAPIASIHKAVDIHFKKYELSPDSVMQVHAKRPLSENQFQDLKAELTTYPKQEIDQSKYDYPANYPERLKKQVDFFKLKDFVNELDQKISKPFNANLPSLFHVPNESPRYKELKNWFEKR